MGKLNVASYNIITQKLALVPIGDASISADDIKTQLDEIYLPYGIVWEVRKEEAFTETSWGGDDGKLDAGESGFFSAYTDEMKALNSAFAEERTVDDEEIYLFVFNSEAANVESGVLLGDMPISSQFGYIFNPDGESIAPKTIAHELGHGMFLLKHTFASTYGIDQGTTDNLMDYSTGTELVKQQWDAIYDPQLTLFAWLQDDEDGEYITNDDEVEWILEIYSPNISENFVTANEQEDYYEMRRLSYWALQNSFDNNWNEEVTFGFELPDGNPVATLRHNQNATYGGVRVYYTIKKYVDEKFVGIMAKTNPIYFAPTSGKYYDAYFPVDINLYDGEGVSQNGDTYYGDEDFIGTFGESSLIVGTGRGSGIMVGYMRGFGYCEYYYTIKGYGYSLSLISSGVITGKYTGARGEQKPDNLSGTGTEQVLGANNAGGTTWESISDGEVVFEGTSLGVVAGYNGVEKLISNLLQLLTSTAAGNLNTCTELLFPLPKEEYDLEGISSSFEDCCCENEIEDFCSDEN